MFDYRPIRALIAMALTSLLCACATTPSVGEHFVMVVKSLPGKRQQLQFHPGLSLAVERGVSRQEVKSDRLLIASCASESENGHSLKRRHGYVLLPEGVVVARYAIIEVAAEEADSTDGPYARYFARYLRHSSATDEDFIPDKYSVTGKEFRCGAVSPEGIMRVQAYWPVKYWDYDLAVAEAARNSQITDEDLERGRIAMGECSPGVDSWARWKVRIPDHMSIKVGDYIEAAAGVSEGYQTGSLAKAIRKVAKPPKDDFIRTQGSDTVGCGARAVPLAGER